MSRLRRLLHTLLLVAASTAIVATPATAMTTLQIEADRTAAVVSIMQKKARKALVNAAQDRAFQRYFATDRIINRRILRFHLDLILANLGKRRRMDHVALVESDGTPVSQVTLTRKKATGRGREQHLPAFLQKTLGGKLRQAHTSPIHRLKGDGKWVISYATPVFHEDTPAGLLYYDQGLDSVQRTLDLLHRDDGIRRLAVAFDGKVIWDSKAPPADSSEHPRRRADPGPSPDEALPSLHLHGLPLPEVIARARQNLPIVDRSGAAHKVAFARVNDWYLLSVARGSGSGEQAGDAR